MRIDFASLAFGYSVRAGGNTPNWATALGQGKEHKINISSEIDDVLRGLTYCSVSPEKISTKIGKGGNVVHGNVENSPIVIGSVFSNVYINEIPIIGGKFVLILTRDTSKSHAGRLRLKYGPANTYYDGDQSYSNQMFYDLVKTQLKLAENACWFVSDISVENQNKLVLKATIVNKYGAMEYADKDELHSAWEKLDQSLIETETEVEVGGCNELFYGVPGSGKSFEIDKKIKDARYERVVFHPDYTYSDFIGQIMPRLKKSDGEAEKLTYEFVPGPFTKALEMAKSYPQEMVYLVIEEINRGNAPAIFGDVFQLLDREDNGASKYHITNFDIAKELYDDEYMEVSIPSNLSIYATMNTSDQNVFTLDTAFQRRWNMIYIKNDIFSADHANQKIENSDITWSQFASTINETLLDYASELGNSEDKQLGAYFIREEELASDLFPEKALKYLWDDAFKMNPDIVFKSNIRSIGDIVLEYQKPGDPIKRVMKKEIYDKMMNMSAENAAEAIDESEVFSTNIEE